MRIFVTREFSRSDIGKAIGAFELTKAAFEINQGLWDASLGGQVFKKRVALAGRGKRSGARTIVAFKCDDRVFYIYGFAKNQKENVSADELRALKRLASELLSYEQIELNIALHHGELIEIEVRQNG